jgi:hypothetical protein
MGSEGRPVMLHEPVRTADGRAIAFPEQPRRSATLEMWRDYLEALSDLPADAPHLHKAIEDAEQTIREKERLRASMRGLDPRD